MKLSIRKIAFTAVLIAIGYFLPFITAQLRDIGNMLCPMHIPVMLCAFVCGAPYAAAAGIVTPLLRSLTVSMPVLYPSAVGMSVELAAYGLVAALVFRRTSRNVKGIYISLVASMIAGRFVWGAVSFLLYKTVGNTFTAELFFSRAFIQPLPGIILQLIVIPPLVSALRKNRFFK